MEEFTEPLTSALGNGLAYRLGLIALKVTRTPKEKIGDEIDRGLILRRYLEEDGFYLVRLIRDAELHVHPTEAGGAGYCPECGVPQIVKHRLSCSHYESPRLGG